MVSQFFTQQALYLSVANVWVGGADLLTGVTRHQVPVLGRIYSLALTENIYHFSNTPDIVLHLGVSWGTGKRP